MSANILNLEQVKKYVDTSKSFPSLIWLKWSVFGHFLLKVSKKEVLARYIIISSKVKKSEAAAVVLQGMQKIIRLKKVK